MKHQRIRIFLLLIGFFLLIHNMDFVKVEVNLNIEKENYKNVKISNLYNATIEVDDLPNSLYDWEWAESQPWCSGSGTKSNPYIIENQVFAINDSGATCLSIKNSEKYFIIENCSFFDTLLSGSGSGVYLYNVTNAKVINSSMHHKYQGIYLDRSYNNLISGNNLTNNRERGILTVESDYNNLSKNLASFNKIGFFIAGGSDYNTLTENICSENSYGIKLFYADYNSFFKFKLLNNGIDVERSNYNTFSENIIQNGGISLIYNHHTSFYLNDIVNSGGLGYSFAYSSDNILFGNNILSSGSSGISFYESRRNEIINNFIENSGEYGIRLYGHVDGAGSCYNDFLNNSILNSNKHGIYLDFSGLNNFSNNIIQGNKESGFYAYISHLVNFEDNTVNNNTLHGVEAYCNSLYNIIGNEIKYNGLNGLYLHRYSDLYNITNNTFEGNINVGLSIQDLSHYNNIFNNYFINNGLNADDSEIDNYWNCSYLGNYWNDYTGVDENDDGIGDTPFAIGKGTDYLPIWRDGPNITINNPFENNLYSNPPDFNITTIDSAIDKKWYTVQTSSIKYFFTQNGTINTTAWYNCIDGNVLIKFFANDTGGNEKFVSINVKKDSNIPEINVISPSSFETFEFSPSFSLNISDYSLNYTWYTLNNGNIKYFFSGVSGDIDNLAWNSISEGYVNITFYANDSFNQVNFVQITIIKDLSYPIITVNSPIKNELFGIAAPSFSVEIYDANLDTMWYTLDNGLTNTMFTKNGTIDQSAWDALPGGNVIIRFYANDSAGNIVFAEVTIRKDVTAPIIAINNPQNSHVIGAIAPNFDISIDEQNLAKTWYSLNGGNNITFTGLTGTINQALWDTLSGGNIIIRFYANDSAGNIVFAEVSIRKDVNAPVITINNPQNSDVIGTTAPNFDISIEESNLAKTWYSLNGGNNMTFLVLTGTINQTLWDTLSGGNVIIRFYANDTLGRIGFQEVIVVKRISQSNFPGIPGYNLLLLLGIISTIAVIIIKKRLYHPI